MYTRMIHFGVQECLVNICSRCDGMRNDQLIVTGSRRVRNRETWGDELRLPGNLTERCQERPSHQASEAVTANIQNMDTPGADVIHHLMICDAE